MEITTAHFSLIAAVITAGGVLWGLFRMVAAAADKLMPVIETTRAQLQAEIDKEVAVMSKSMHDKYNHSQQICSKLEADLRRLEREGVSKEDMKASEARLTASFERVVTKLDAITDRVSELPMLERQVNSMDTRLTEISRSLNGGPRSA